MAKIKLIKEVVNLPVTYSYDIFDTIVTRRTATPYGIFAIVQEKLKCLNEDIPEEFKENFYELRIQGEHAARYFFSEKGYEEVTLSQIYWKINTTAMLNEDTLNRIMDIECETEIENILPIQDIVDEVLKHIEKRDNVIFVSDMYLDYVTISKILENVNKKFKDVHLFLSSELGKTKATGSLFQFIHNTRKIAYENWIHTGDDYNSDIVVPKKLGIETVQVPNRLLIPIEKAILKDCEDDHSLQLLVGISKNARILKALKDEENIGASLSGCLLGAYVNWIIKDALRRGIKTLYFISRDGFVLKKMADVFISNMGYDMSTKYIYGSRKAWRIPAQDSKHINVLAFLRMCTPEFVYDMRMVSELFEIPFFKFVTFLPRNIRKKNYRLSRIDIDILFYYLSESEEFKEYLAIVNDEKGKMILAYLKQEINLNEDEIAFVEVGGTGYTQKCLEGILKKIYNGQISTYFFQMYSINETQFFNFIPDVLHIKAAIEPLCRAPHGQTLGYVKRATRVEPILEDLKSRDFYQKHYSKYINGLISYADIYMKYYKEIFQKPTNRKMVKKCWDYYTHVRDESILNFVGDMPFGSIGLEGEGSKYAPRLSKENIKEIFFTHNKEPLAWSYQGGSIEMSILRMDEEDKKLLNQYKGLKNDKTKIERLITNQKNISLFAKIPQNRYCNEMKIVIYGAGGLGKEFYYYAKKGQSYKVVLWADRQYLKHKEDGYPVSCPEDILGISFDILVIAVLDKKVRDSIKNDLLQLGIPEEKMDWIPYKDLLEGYEEIPCMVNLSEL